MILFYETTTDENKNRRLFIPTGQNWSEKDLTNLNLNEIEAKKTSSGRLQLIEFNDIIIVSNGEDKDDSIVVRNFEEKEVSRNNRENLLLQDSRICELSDEKKQVLSARLIDLFKTSQLKIEEFKRVKSKSFPWETMTKNTDLSFHWTHLDETFNSIGDILNSADLAETTSQSTIAKTTGRNRIFTMPRFIILLVLGLNLYIADPSPKIINLLHKMSKSSYSNSNIDCYKKILNYFPEDWVDGNKPNYSNVNDETELAKMVLKNLEKLLGTKNQISMIGTQKTTPQDFESKIKKLLLDICDITGSPQEKNIKLQVLVISDNPPNKLDKIFPKRKHAFKGLILQKEGDLANLPFEDLKRLREIQNKLVKLSEDIKKIGSVIDESDALTNPQENILKTLEGFKLCKPFEFTGFQAYTNRDIETYDSMRTFINDLMKSIEAYDKNYKRSGKSFVKDFASAPLKEDNAKENSKATACWNQLVAIHKEFNKFQ